MARRYCYKDVVPVAAMVAVECSNVVSNILFKAASSKGLTYYIFLASLSTLVLFPIAFFHIRKAGLPPFKFPLISRFCLVGVLGFSSQLCAYKGLELSTPTLSSAISNLVPAFTFILAVFFRMENVELRSSSTQAKVIGTIGSISAASMVVLYKGPKVLSTLHWTCPTVLLQKPLGSSESNWMIGGLLITVAYLLSSLWYIIQTQIMKIYPEEMTVNFIYYLFVAILSVPLSILAESTMSSWRLSPSVVAASILYTGIFALCFSSVVHTWGVHLKGPVYVAIFRPLSIVIAAIMSAIFLGDALYLGSVVGALILSAGLYAVLWGKAKEEKGMTFDDSGSCSGPLSNCKVSLLQSLNDEQM